MDLPFSIPISGIIRFNGGSITITVNQSQVTLELPAEFGTQLARKKPGPRINLADMVLESALVLSHQRNTPRFTATELYHTALEKHPWVNRRSFLARVIGTAPDHSSFHHFKSQRRYLRYVGDGKFMLLPKDEIWSDLNYEPSGIDETLWEETNVR